jgi:hypothetical protein
MTFILNVNPLLIVRKVVLSGLVVSVLAIEPKGRSSYPAEGNVLFQGYNIPQHAFLRKGSKSRRPNVVRFYDMLKILRSIKEVLPEVKFISFVPSSCFATI